MKKKQLWVRVAIIGVVTAGLVFYFTSGSPNIEKNPTQKIASPTKAQSGHWLKTTEENESLRVKKRQVQVSPKPTVRKKQEPALNSTTKNINILYLWTEGSRPKVISIMTMNQDTQKAAIVIIPLFARIEWEGRKTTLEGLYAQEGRLAVWHFLQEKLGVKIPYYVNVEQRALVKISDIVGPFTVGGEKMTMSDAFEQTALGMRHNDQEIVRAVARQTFKPHIILSIPKLIWIFTHDITTNLGTENMLKLYQLSRDINLGNMLKIVLPGDERWVNGEKLLFVEQYTWDNILYEVSK